MSNNSNPNSESEAYLQALESLRQYKLTYPRLLFNPHPKQQLVTQSKAKNIFIIGGNRSGKTEIVIKETLDEWEGTHPNRWLRPRPDGTPCMVYMCSSDPQIQRDVSQSKFDRFIPREWISGVWKRSEAYSLVKLRVPNVRFGTLDIHLVWKTYQEKALDFESVSLDQAVTDEEPPRVIYNAIQTRLLDAKSWGNGWFKNASTQIHCEGWIITDVLDKANAGLLEDDTFVVEMSTYDNAINIGGYEEIKKWADALPEEEREIRLYGWSRSKKSFALDKFIPILYNNQHWGVSGHLLIPFYPDWSVFTPYESIDYGYTNPMAVGFYAVHMSGFVVKYDEIYERQKTIPFIKGLMYKKRRQYGYAEPRITLIDPSANAKHGSPESKVAQFCSDDWNVWVGEGMEPTENKVHNLRKAVMDGRLSHSDFDKQSKAIGLREGYISYRVPVSNANNSKKVGWEIVGSYLDWDVKLNRPKFFVTNNCKEFIREAKAAKARRKADGSMDETKIQGDNHSLDETRYMLAAKPSFVKNYNGIRRKIGPPERRVKR